MNMMHSSKESFPLPLDLTKVDWKSGGALAISPGNNPDFYVTLRHLTCFRQDLLIVIGSISTDA
jgi:hypothetical protein